MVKVFSLIILLTQLSGCGFIRSVWNAAPPKRSTVEMKASALPSFTQVFSTNEDESKTALNAWRKNITDSFRMIEGKQKDFLSSQEIKTLVMKGLVKLDSDTGVSTDRALAVLEILGFKDGIALKDVESLFDWVSEHKTEARTFHELFLNNSKDATTVHARNLVEVLNLFGSLVSLGGDQSIPVDHLTDLLQPWIPNSYPHAKKALKSSLKLSVSFFASFCGDRVDASNWNGKRIGQCLHDVIEYFKDTSPAFDFMFGAVSPLSHREELETASSLLPVRVHSWMQGHHHPLFSIALVERLAKDLEIPPPYAFIRMTEWIPLLNSDSTHEGFSPTFFADLAEVTHQWISSTLKATENQQCSESNWKLCEFTGKYKPADELFNAEYATLIRTKSLGYVSKIALYDSLSSFLFTKLDTDQTGHLKGNIKDLVNIAIRVLDSNAFTQNVIAGVLEEPIDPQNLEDSLKSHTRQGLSELAALASDILPERDQSHRSLLMKLQAQIFSREKEIPYTLDRTGLTAFIYLYDLIGELRVDFLKRYDLPIRTSGALSFVKRRKIIEALPKILFDHFPRIYNECVKNGFERTCGVLFTEILPDCSPGKDELETYEMDVMTLTGVLMESMMNRCDRNDDDLLTTSVVDGFDEKTCMITVSTALAKRLMNANFIDQNNNVNFLLYLTNHFILTRWAAKAAISRGTLKNVAWYALPGLTLKTGPATIGSIIKLAAEIMDPAKVDAIENKTIGHIDTPGDELIYGNQLTDHYLPSPNAAPRFNHAPRRN